MRRLITLLKQCLRQLVVVGGAFLFSLVCFLVLPLMQSITAPATADTVVRSIDAVTPPPPAPPPEEKPPEKEKEPEPQPELNEQAPPLDLSQLELALNPGFGGDGLLPDMASKLIATNTGGDVDTLFSLADLDQKPRVIYQPAPNLNTQMRKQAPATVYVLFIVDANGRVQDARVQSSTDPVFDAAAISAVSKWKFEPGKRSGEAVRFRMRVPIIFPRSQ